MKANAWDTNRLSIKGFHKFTISMEKFLRTHLSDPLMTMLDLTRNGLENIFNLLFVKQTKVSANTCACSSRK